MTATLLLTVILNISGDPGTHVRGQCIVDPDSATVDIDTTVPYQRTFAAAGLRCSFAADGRAVIEVEKNGSRSRAATNGGRININVVSTLSRMSVCLRRAPHPTPLPLAGEGGERKRAGEGNAECSFTPSRPSPHPSPVGRGSESSSPRPSSTGRGRTQAAGHITLSRREREASGRERVRGRSCAARLGRCFLVAALAFLPLAAEAADVAAMKVFGLALGDDRNTVAEAFPNMVFEPVDYADPVVGYTYEAALGRRAVERLEGRGFRPVPGRSPTEFVVRLTGDGRLYELSAWERFDRPVGCAKKIREWTKTYGPPDVQVLDEQVQWIERDIGVERMLDIRCWPEGRVAWQLTNARALADWREVLRERLRPYVEQVEIQDRSPLVPQMINPADVSH